MSASMLIMHGNNDWNDVWSESNHSKINGKTIKRNRIGGGTLVLGGMAGTGTLFATASSLGVGVAACAGLAVSMMVGAVAGARTGNRE